MSGAGWQQDRIHQKIKEVDQQWGAEINQLLVELNRLRLNGGGKVNESPAASKNSLRWTLTWKDAAGIHFEINVVARFEDDGHQARLAGIFVHRHASTPIAFEGHTPTTKMRKISQLSLAAIRDAIAAEWP